MLVGLFQANQDAFDRGNMNRLKAGRILAVPDKAALLAIPRDEANRVVIAQSMCIRDSPQAACHRLARPLD